MLETDWPFEGSEKKLHQKMLLQSQKLLPVGYNFLYLDKVSKFRILIYYSKVLTVDPSSGSTDGQQAGYTLGRVLKSTFLLSLKRAKS